MIISASRRTDLPAYYPKWLLNRLISGFAMTRNPMNPAQVRRVDLSPEAVDAIVIWTKNPLPLLNSPNVGMLNDFTCCFQFTMTSYGKDVEPGIPSKSKELIPAFEAIAERFGSKSAVWRYDPILINEKYTIDYHLRYFSEMARRLKGATERCVISFFDNYRCNEKRVQRLGIRELPDAERLLLAGNLAAIAKANGMEIFACAEEIDFTGVGIQASSCIDAALLSEISGKRISAAKDRNQRVACGCAASVDIGAYDTCPGGCLYCYATRSETKSAANFGRHDPMSPFLIE